MDRIIGASGDRDPSPQTLLLKQPDAHSRAAHPALKELLLSSTQDSPGEIYVENLSQHFILPHRNLFHLQHTMGRNPHRAPQ